MFEAPSKVRIVEGLASAVTGERVDVGMLTRLVGRHEWSMLVGGSLVQAKGGSGYNDASPVLDDVIAKIPDAGPAEVDAAVQAAEKASVGWAATPISDRTRRVLEMARRVRAHAAEFGALDTLDGGNTIKLATSDAVAAAETMEYFAAVGAAVTGQTIPASSGNLHYTLQKPYQVVARIVPYNHPIRFVAGKTAAPLMAGAPVIIKAAHQTPLSALYFSELVRDVLPSGVLSILTGSGSQTPSALVRHPRVRRIAFTGSVPTGLAVQQAASQTGIKHVSLELGGKNALIAFGDANPAEVARGVLRGMNFAWSGQSCGSTSRLIIHRSILGETLRRLSTAVAGLHMCDPFDPRASVGTLVSRTQYEKVLRYLDIATSEGARALIGGGAVSVPDRKTALFVAPTVLVDVEPGMRVAQEEIFGPVAVVMPFDTEDEAVELANSVEYGLTSAIWTNDLRLAHRVASAVDAGYVWVNTASTHFLGTPFGGVKSSGLGREESLGEIYSYTETKTVHVAL